MGAALVRATARITMLSLVILSVPLGCWYGWVDPVRFNT